MNTRRKHRIQPPGPGARLARATLPNRSEAQLRSLRSRSESADDSKDYGALRLLGIDVRMLDDLRDANGDTELSADAGTLWHVLEAMGRVLAERLREQYEYTPVDMQAVVEVAQRLRWAADEATRIRPVEVVASEGAVRKCR